MIDFLPLILGIFLAQASPGPNMMAVSSIALGSGRRAGMLTAVGVAAGVFVWALLFTMGIGAVFETFPGSITAMKLLGGGYLFYLGCRALLTAFRDRNASANTVGLTVSGPRAFRTGLLVVLTNPKAALMWIAVSIFLASAHLTNSQFLFIGFCMSLSAMAIYGTYALLFSTGLAMRGYRRAAKYVEGAFGAIFGALGIRLISEGIRELRA
jgi:threonine/homoserine/homoserine lactone efflux protein